MEKNLIKHAFDKHGTDKGYDHGYHEMYENIFSKFIPSSILEIGVEYGKSIAAWCDLFPNAKITGIDLQRHNLVIDQKKFNYIIGDSTDIETVKMLGQYDIIIDDASNDLIDQLLTFKLLQSNFKNFYVIEDIYSTVENKNDRVDVLKNKIDMMGYNNNYIVSSKKTKNNKLMNTKALVIKKGF